MAEAYIIDAVRTPVGRRGKGLAGVHPLDLAAAPLRELVAWCKEQGIPTVFWNKEDPPNYERFIETAKLFDRVFTVDVDCVPRYVKDLGHDRVEVLPFAAAPRIHNPIAAPDGRTFDIAFAGTYFAEKHPVVHNLVISNVPGPRTTQYFNGAELLGTYPLSVPIDGNALNITCNSYADQMAFGLTGCRRTVPHLQRILTYLDDEIGALEKAAGV